MLNTASLLSLLGVLLPLASAAVSNNKVIPAWAAGYVTLLLSAVIGFVSQWANDPDPSHYNWQAALATFGTTFVVAALSRITVHANTPPSEKLDELGARRKARKRPTPGKHEAAA